MPNTTDVNKHREVFSSTLAAVVVEIYWRRVTPALSGDHIRRLMTAFSQGDRRAADDLVAIFYPQLRRLATSHLRGERCGHSWHPTLLVNELYLELIKIKAFSPPDEDGGDAKAAFFGLAAHLMRRLLIHHARPLREKAVKLDLADWDMSSAAGQVAEIELALSRLEAIRPRLRSIVELKVFEGMTLDEIAQRLDCSTATVTREWHFAKHVLQEQFGFRNY
jgi:RNA polymerase sigma factor (TIGR02999 family)